MQMPERIISSPLNYTGGKAKLLPQLLPLFPDSVSVFVDLFCGGANVGVNVTAENCICNDVNSELVGLLHIFQTIPTEELLNKIKTIIADYSLSDSYSYGYQFYGCNSSAGLGKYNSQGYLALRENFNRLKKKDEDYFLKLFVLIIFSFNNQIRFNSTGNFNLPVGKRDFNIRMQKKLQDFSQVLKNKNLQIVNLDFQKFPVESLPVNSFLYADPPYRITCASYNEKNGWTEKDDIRLLQFLDRCHSLNIRFALSNVLEVNGKKNEILKSWLTDNKSFFCYHLLFSYKNSNYHKHERYVASVADEVLITNYGA